MSEEIPKYDERVRDRLQQMALLQTQNEQLKQDWRDMNAMFLALTTELAALRERVEAAIEPCTKCGGKGGFDDTTYIRTGEWCQCEKCHGRGRVVNQALFFATLPLNPKPESKVKPCADESTGSTASSSSLILTTKETATCDQTGASNAASNVPSVEAAVCPDCHQPWSAHEPTVPKPGCPQAVAKEEGRSAIDKAVDEAWRRAPQARVPNRLSPAPSQPVAGSGTPETDEQEFNESCNFDVPWSEFARNLERQRNEARTELAQAKAEADGLRETMTMMEKDIETERDRTATLTAQLSEARRDKSLAVAKLAHADEKISELQHYIRTGHLKGEQP